MQPFILFPQLMSVNCNDQVSLRWLESVPSLVLEYYFSFGLVPLMQPQKTTRCQVDIVNFVFILLFLYLYLDDDVFAHLVTLLKNEAGQSPAQNEYRLRTHARDGIGPQRKTQQKDVGRIQIGVLFFKQAHYNIYSSFPIFG